jgi:hypothetical protein
MPHNRRKLPKMLGYEPFTTLAQGAQSRKVFVQDRCPPARTDVPMDSSNRQVRERNDEPHLKRLVEHHGQLHDLDHGEWEATYPTEDRLLSFTELLANDGNFKPVISKIPREEYL